MILPSLRPDLDVMISPVEDRPGLLIRDSYRYSDATLIVPPPLVPSLALFDGTRTDQELQTELTRTLGVEEIERVTRLLIESLSNAGFLEDETFTNLKEARHNAFLQSPVRLAAHAGTAYPADLEALQSTMRSYLDSTATPEQGLIGIAAPHISPEGGWQSYRAAYGTLPPDLSDRTFVILGTSHYGAPDQFGLTRKPFETPYGTTAIDERLVNELALQPATLMEDYCHAVEHSIEFQVLFLQAIYGPQVRILPILCGPFRRHGDSGGLPEQNAHVQQFFSALQAIAAREGNRLFWVLGIDMAHMGVRYGDDFAAHALQDQMAQVSDRDSLRIAQINASDPQHFWNLVQKNGGDDLKWCGASTLYTFLKAVPHTRGTLRRYEQWNIDEQSVVSFAGISFSF